MADSFAPMRELRADPRRGERLRTGCTEERRVPSGKSKEHVQNPGGRQFQY
jgi:hypothetical protein